MAENRDVETAPQKRLAETEVAGRQRAHDRHALPPHNAMFEWRKSVVETTS